MIRQRFASTTAEIARILKGVAPPLIPQVFSGDTRLIRRWRNDPFEANVRPMQHHIIVAKFAGDGRTWMRAGRRDLFTPSEPGTVTLVPRGHEGHRRMDGVAEVASVHLGHERMIACAEQLGNGRRPELLDRSNIRDPKLFAIIKLISDEIESEEPLSRLFTEQLLDLLCLQLVRAHSAFALPASQPLRGGLAGWQIRRVTSYMCDNLAGDITLQELADLANLSRFHFCAAFRIATGSSPYEWLTAQRIASARKLLADRTLRVADIALAVGYQTPSAFSARFRRVTGVSPSEFRRQL